MSGVVIVSIVAIGLLFLYLALFTYLEYKVSIEEEKTKQMRLQSDVNFDDLK